MAKTRVFISFDYDHDADLKKLLVGQAKNPDSPFEIADFSIKEPVTGDWKKKAQARMKAVQQIIVICGTRTDSASGVATEVRLAQEEKRPYFLLHGRTDKQCKKPTSAKPTDKVYKWTWDNLKALIGGAR